MTAAGVYRVEILNDGSVVVSRDGVTAYGDTFDTAMIQWLRLRMASATTKPAVN